jgi:hypothetical protein
VCGHIDRRPAVFVDGFERDIDLNVVARKGEDLDPADRAKKLSLCGSDPVFDAREHVGVCANACDSV